jgi:hypothetical protein
MKRAQRDDSRSHSDMSRQRAGKGFAERITPTFRM